MPTFTLCAPTANHAPASQILNALYGKLARAMTEWENHRTDDDHERSLITKLCAHAEPPLLPL